MNTIRISGFVVDKPLYSHTVHGEKFYEFYVQCVRKSKNTDSIKCIISETYVHKADVMFGIGIIGEVRTRIATREDNTAFCDVYVFVKEVVDYNFNGDYDENTVEIDGYICKTPVYRKTPKGRKITDIIVASTRENSFKTDYIPTIAWGRTALRVANMEIGTHVKVVGRMQSREYQKRLSDDLCETRTAYELSVMEMEVVEDAE